MSRPPMMPQRPMVQQQPQPQGPGYQRGLRNPDYLQIPKVPPPGARVSYNGVNITAPFVAMTFDDGPHPVHTPRLLNMLRERNIKATFYVIGRSAQAHPNIIRRILAEGHEIGNHTWDHPSLSSISELKAREQLTKSARAITAMTGYHMRTMRPPYGATNQYIKEWIHRDYGYPTIMWTVDPMDWKRPGASVVTSRILAGARPGAIILAHDIHQATIDAMPNTFDGLLSRGYKFVTVSQLLNMEMRPVASAPAPMEGPVAPTSMPSIPGPLSPTQGMGPGSPPSLMLPPGT
ncbi:polysaccharide deacetylase family protein [Phragmitibacter flavus]|nr:polysaccharide deacetylase family protein [Phragmitibacter flavus]